MLLLQLMIVKDGTYDGSHCIQYIYQQYFPSWHGSFVGVMWDNSYWLPCNNIFSKGTLFFQQGFTYELFTIIIESHDKNLFHPKIFSGRVDYIHSKQFDFSQCYCILLTKAKPIYFSLIIQLLVLQASSIIYFSFNKLCFFICFIVEDQKSDGSVFMKVSINQKYS